jgi:hypothetical protein
MPAAIPKHEPEVRRAKGRAYAARCNEIANNYDSKTIYQALELSEQAHAVLGLPYATGLSNLKEFPPSRFEWTCEQAAGYAWPVAGSTQERCRPSWAIVRSQTQSSTPR